MIFLYIILGILLLVILAILIPIKIKINYNVETEFNKEKRKEQLHTVANIKIYLFYFLKIKTINSDNKENAGRRKKVFKVIYKFLINFLNFRKINTALVKKEELKKISDSIYFKMLDLDIGINSKNILANVYLMSTLNGLINMYFAYKSDKMDLDKVKYKTYISNKIVNLKVDSIIRFNLVNTIIIIIKIILRYRKVVKEDGKTTSNRKLNDDSYDFA